MTTKKFSDPKSDPIKAIREAADDMKKPVVKRVRKPATVKEQVATAAVDEQVDDAGLYELLMRHAKSALPKRVYREAQQVPNEPWQAPTWMIAALKEARQQGNDEGRMTAEFVAEQAAEQYQRDLDGVVRATIANVLESYSFKHGEEPPREVTLDNAKIATIYDRVTLDFTDQGNEKFTYRIFPGAAKAR